MTALRGQASAPCSWPTWAADWCGHAAHFWTRGFHLCDL